MAIKRKKKKTVTVVEHGKIYITATFNNTIITISDQTNKPILIRSCGMFGFSGTRKSTPFAATKTVESAVSVAIDEHGLRTADVYIKGIGPGREASLRVLRSADIDIEKIIDVTPIPHNGVRPPKVRRV